MKNTLWVIVVIIAFFIGMLMGYTVRAYMDKSVENMSQTESGGY